MPCFAGSQAAVSSWQVHGTACCMAVLGWWESAAAWCSFSTMSWSYYQMQWMEPAACQPPTLSPADILFWIWLWALTQAGDDIIVKLRVGSQKMRAELRYSNHYPASIKTQVRNLTSSDSLCILHLRTIINTIHQLRGGGEEDLLLWFLIFFGECWTTHARAQFNLNLC